MCLHIALLIDRYASFQVQILTVCFIALYPTYILHELNWCAKLAGYYKVTNLISCSFPDVPDTRNDTI